jgi:hypothetical protein
MEYLGARCGRNFVGGRCGEEQGKGDVFGRVSGVVSSPGP